MCESEGGSGFRLDPLMRPDVVLIFGLETCCHSRTITGWGGGKTHPLGLLSIGLQVHCKPPSCYHRYIIQVRGCARPSPVAVVGTKTSRGFLSVVGLHRKTVWCYPAKLRNKECLYIFKRHAALP